MQGCRASAKRAGAVTSVASAHTSTTPKTAAHRMPPMPDQTPPSFNWSLNANAADNLAAVGGAFSPIKKVSDQVATNTKELSRQMTNRMFLPFDKNGTEHHLLDEDGDGLDDRDHAPHVDEAAELRKEVEALTKRSALTLTLTLTLALTLTLTLALALALTLTPTLTLTRP